MTQIHDMGGRFDDGPVRPEGEDEPIFHEEWHRRAMAVTLASLPWLAFITLSVNGCSCDGAVPPMSRAAALAAPLLVFAPGGPPAGFAVLIDGPSRGDRPDADGCPGAFKAADDGMAPRRLKEIRS